MMINDMLVRPSENRVVALLLLIESGDPRESVGHMIHNVRMIEASPFYDGATPIVFPADSERILEGMKVLTGGEIHISRTDNYRHAIRLVGRDKVEGE